MKGSNYFNTDSNSITTSASQSTSRPSHSLESKYGSKISLKKPKGKTLYQRTSFTPGRLNRILGQEEHYQMLSRDDILNARMETLFTQKRAELHALRLKYAKASGQTSYATKGDEFMLRYELKQQIKQKAGKLVEDEYFSEKVVREAAKNNILNSRDAYNGRSVLHIASASGYFHLVRMLCYEFEANVNLTTVLGNCTPLHLAVEGGYRQIVALLLARGAFVDAQDKIGNTPLHLANKMSIVKLLLKNNADAAIRNVHNRTAKEEYLHRVPTSEQEKQIVEMIEAKEEHRMLEITRMLVNKDKNLREADLNKAALVNDKLSTSTEKVQSKGLSTSRKAPLLLNYAEEDDGDDERD